MMQATTINRRISEILETARKHGSCLVLDTHFGEVRCTYQNIRGLGMYTIRTYPPSTATRERELSYGNRTVARDWFDAHLREI